MQTLGEFYDLKSNMLEKEENIISNTDGKSTEERTFKIVKWFVHNEASISPIRLTSFNPDVSANIKGTKNKNDKLRSLTKSDEDTPRGKKGKRNDKPRQKDNTKRALIYNQF